MAKQAQSQMLGQKSLKQLREELGLDSWNKRRCWKAAAETWSADSKPYSRLARWPVGRLQKPPPFWRTVEGWSHRLLAIPHWKLSSTLRNPGPIRGCLGSNNWSSKTDLQKIKLVKDANFNSGKAASYKFCIAIFIFGIKFIEVKRNRHPWSSHHRTRCLLRQARFFHGNL